MSSMGSLIPTEAASVVSAQGQGKANGKGPTERSSKPCLIQKLAEIVAVIDHVDKAGRNDFQKYNYVKAADVARAVRKALSDKNIYLVSDVVEIRNYEIPAREGVMQAVDVKMQFSFFDGDSPETLPIVFHSYGTGTDKGDKAVYKAMTGALKYGLRHGFIIPDESDPEADSNTDKITAGTKEAATAVGEQKVKDLEAAKRAKQQGNGADLTKPLADSITAIQTAKPAGNGHSKPSLDEMLQAAKEADLFEELSGTLLEVKDMKTTPAQGNRPFKRLVIATDAWGEIKDMEVSSFDNLTLSDGHLWDNLIPFYINSPITILVEKRESKGKTYYNLRDIKKLGQKSWDQRLASIQNEAR